MFPTDPTPSDSDRRRLLGATLFAAGAALAAGLPVGRPGLIAAVLIAAAACVPRHGRGRAAAGAAAALAAGIGAGAWHAAADPIPPLLARWERQGLADSGGIVAIRGRILDDALLPDGRRELIVRLQRLRPAGGCEEAPGRGGAVRVRLIAPPQAERGAARAPFGEPGDLLRGSVRLGPPRPFRNPGGFDYERYLRARGLSLVGTIKSPRLLQAEPDRWSAAAGFLPRARRLLLRRLRRACGASEERTAAFLGALLLGERQAMDRDLERTLQRAGVFHIVALSGLNVGLVALLAAGAARIAGGGPRAARAAAAIAVAAYWGVARDGGSIDRASIMGLLVAGGGLLGRRVRPIGAVAVSAVLLLARQPAWAADAGFQLSYAATLGILILGLPGARRAPSSRAGSVLRAGRDAARVSGAAWGATALIAARHFHALTPAALPANLVAVPLAGGLLGLAIFLALVGRGGGSLARVVAQAAGGLVWILERVSALCAAPPFLSFRVLPPGATAVLAGSALLFLAARGAGWRRLALAALAALLVSVAVAGRGRPSPGPLEVVALDVGQGDAILVRLPGGVSLLVDAGAVARSGFDLGERVVAPAVRSLGLLRIDLLALTHAHRDHLGGARALLEELAPRAVWLGRMPDDDPAVVALEEAAAARGIPILRPRRGVGLSMGGARLEVLHPPSSAGASGRNDDSLVLRVVHRERAVLLTGDIEGPAEAALVGAGVALKADLLKVAHHGSRTSTGPAFLAAVRPRLGVISVGATNAWGHPDPAVVDRLRGAGARVLRTDRDGALRFRTDGSGPWRVDAPGAR